MRLTPRRTKPASRTATSKHPRGPVDMRGRPAGNHRYDLTAFLTDHKVAEAHTPVAAFQSGRNPRSQHEAYTPKGM